MLPLYVSQSAMRAIRYGVCCKMKIMWAFKICRNPLCVQLDMEFASMNVAMLHLASQSAMRAIRYGADMDEHNTILIVSRNPLCVQLDMEK